MTRSGRALRLVGLVLVVTAAVAWCSGALRTVYGEPIDGHVVDARTGQPIAGAHVMYLWETGIESTSFSGHNAPDICYHAAAAVTGEQGQFHIDAWRERARYRVPNREPSAWAYAPGYVPAELRPPGDTEREPTVRTDQVIRLQRSDAGGDRRLEELWNLIRRDCAHGGASQRSLYPMLKSAYEEARRIALTPEQMKRVRTFAEFAAIAWIAPSPNTDAGTTSAQIEHFIRERLQ
jgi:hypothetical protein